MRKISILTAILAFLPVLAGAQEPRMSIREAEKLIPREVRRPVKSMIPGDKPLAHDTLDTSDPVIKIVLLNDGTWHYVPRQIKVFSPFGWRRRRNHMGVDLPLPMRTPVYAAFDGKVRCSMYNRGYGNVVIIRHASGLETTYAHLAERRVSAGDYVSAGDVIGLGGSTGRSSGPHLHFETRYDGYAFDPQWLIDFETGVLRHGYFVLKRKYLTPTSKYYPESEEEEEEIYKTEEEERAEAERIAKEMAAARYHTIKAGDNLSRLAVKYNTTVNAICKLNGITPSTTLKIGKKLRVK